MITTRRRKGALKMAARRNETVLPRRRSGRTNVLSGTEDRLSRRLAGPASAHLPSGSPLRPATWPTLQRIFFLSRQAAALKAARAVFAQPLTLHLPRVERTVLDPRPGVAPMPRCGAGPTQHGPAVCGALRPFQRGPEAQARCAPPSSLAR